MSTRKIKFGKEELKALIEHSIDENTKESFEAALDLCWGDSAIRHVIEDNGGIWSGDQVIVELRAVDTMCEKLYDFCDNLNDTLDNEKLNKELDDEEFGPETIKRLNHLDVENFADLFESYLVYHFVRLSFTGAWGSLTSFNLEEYMLEIDPE